MSIETYGVGKRMELVARSLSFVDCKHLVVLPIPTTKDRKHITNTDILLDETLVNVCEDSKIIGYGLPEEYRARAEALGAVVFDVADDEEFLERNSYITAIGALGYILSTTDKEPSELCVGIFGYGRIGAALARMLLFFGAKLIVYTSKILSRIELGTYGIDSVSVKTSSKDDCSLEGLDIFINTAPTDMTEVVGGEKIPYGIRVIELASGNNFKGIDGVESLPGIPEKMYPESAAKAYLEAIKRFLNKDF